MCARSVCVLVLCCVTSWAQRHPNFFNRFGNMPENPDFFPQKGFPPFDQFPGPDNPEQPVYPYGTTPKVIIVQAPGFPGMPGDPNEYPHLMTPSFEQTDFENVDTQKPGKVRLAGLPTELKVFPLQLNHSYNELQFNVSWVPSAEFPATGYSIEVASLNKSVYCQSQICFRSDIHENQTWALIPQTFDIVHGGCSIHPGCSYLVKLTAHPSDGKHSTNLKVPLKECEAGVCSCAHREHLPVPVVTAQSFADGSNTTIRWILPAPSRLQRLPLMLGKRSYIIQLGKQSPVPHTPPLFETIPNKRWFNKTKGLVLEGDTERLMPIHISQEIMLRTKLIAAVSLVDERDCVGNPGIATVFDPEEIQRNEQKESKTNLSFGVYAILGALIGAWAMGAVFVLSARVVKRVLKSLRPAPVSAPLEPLRRRPAWFPLQLRT